MYVNSTCTGNAATRHGQQGEILALRKLAEDGMTVTKKGTVVSPTYPWLSASPDGIVNDTNLLEIKCPVPNPNWSTLDELFSGGKYDVCKVNGSLTLKENGSRGYYMQVQLALYCTGLQLCKFVVWTADQYVIVDVPINEDYIAKLVSRLKSFYFLHMLPRLADDFQSKRLILSKTYRDCVC
jgi:hypothetical protein